MRSITNKKNKIKQSYRLSCEILENYELPIEYRKKKLKSTDKILFNSLHSAAFVYRSWDANEKGSETHSNES